MFKSKLQEYCQSKAWLLPSYEVTREGPDHCPRFKASVDVNGVSFTSPDFFRSTKEAQNLAAMLAFEYFTGIDQLPEIEQTSPVASREGIGQLPETQQTSPIASCNVPKGNGMHMYKNQLQIYAQKRKLELPAYSTERVGPCHSSRFKCMVTVEDKTYESEDYFSTVKDAECSAAKVALASIFPKGFEEDDPVIYKNLLQELLRKEMSCLPKYATTREGPSHTPEFVSVVEIQGEIFRGQVAKTKKQAEMSVAKVAYTTLRERKQKQDDDDRLDDVKASPKKSLQFPASSVPESGSDFQPMIDKQDKCTEATFNSSRTIPDGIQELEDAQSTEVPIYWEDTASSSSSLDPVNGLSVKEKSKKKIRVLPKSSTRSYPDAAVRYSDEKWTAFNTD